MSEILSFFSMPFVRYALLALGAGGLIAGLLGPLVFVRRIGLVSAGISHSLLGVVGVALLLNWNLDWILLPSAVVLALIMGAIDRRARVGYGEVAIALIWSVGMAIGVLAMSKVKTYVPSAMSYLFGSVFLLRKADVIASWAVFGLTLVSLLLFGRAMMVSAVDEDFATAQGLNTSFLYYLLLILSSLAVVVLLKSLGVILTISLFLVPPAVASRRARNLGQMFLISMAVSLLSCLGGLFLSLWLDAPVSVGVVFLLLGLYLVM